MGFLIILKEKSLKEETTDGPIFFLSDQLYFPPVDQANAEGLLAVGGNLSSERLLLAYQSGIFPWFNDDAFLMWWSPKTRMVLYPEEVKVSKSMQKVIRSGQFRLTKNKRFKAVIEHCSAVPRDGQEGTWITGDMKKAYLELHKKGFATSYEVWDEKELVGGLYGIDLGHIFCGESMFSLKANASKFAFIQMAKELEGKNYKLIDCQLYTDHLASLGAREIERTLFMKRLKGQN